MKISIKIGSKLMINALMKITKIKTKIKIKMRTKNNKKTKIC